ncbi:hypothetical protein [Calothrix sp. NIES-2098]|uniref:hypothetical protein n=1 Tax=Calothrix sp. NIES-2098 TaxID=1954171 RepID=UPI0030DBB4BA
MSERSFSQLCDRCSPISSNLIARPTAIAYNYLNYERSLKRIRKRSLLKIRRRSH